jgi:hypothetical protein
LGLLLALPQKTNAPAAIAPGNVPKTLNIEYPCGMAACCGGNERTEAGFTWAE